MRDESNEAFDFAGYDDWRTTDTAWDHEPRNAVGIATCPCGTRFVPMDRGQTSCDACIDRARLRRATRAAQPNAPTAPLLVADGDARGIEVDTKPLANGLEGQRPVEVDIVVEEERAGVLPPDAPARMVRSLVEAEVAERLVEHGDRDVIEQLQRAAVAAEGAEGVVEVGRIVPGMGQREQPPLSHATDRDTAAAPTPHESRLPWKPADREEAAGPKEEDVMDSTAYVIRSTRLAGPPMYYQGSVSGAGRGYTPNACYAKRYDSVGSALLAAEKGEQVVQMRMAPTDAPPIEKVGERWEAR